MRNTVFAILFLLTAACNSPAGLGVDLARYEPLPALHALDFEGMRPADAWDYWELRFSMGPGAADSVVGGAGSVPRDALPAPVVARLDALRPQAGFAIGCLPAFCFFYIAAARDEDVASVASPDALRSFLGHLDSAGEAALLVRAMGYTWDPRDEATGYREQPGGGWSFVVLQLVAACTPVQTDRVLLHVARDGSVAERRREVWQKNSRACI